MAKILKNSTASKTATKTTSDKKSATKTTSDKKTGVKKREKKRKSGEKRRGTPKTPKRGTTQKIDLDYVEDDDVLNEGDENIPSEDEGGSDDERKHQKLLEAISALGGKKKRKLAERSEATIQISEFSVDAKGEGDKINLSDLIQTIANTPAVSAQTKAHLKKLKLKDKTVDSPLSKQETERIQRNIAFQKTAGEVSRWQSIIRQNQKAEQQVFPLNQEAPGPKPIEQVVCGWKARTPLEQEIFLLLSANKQPINNPVLTPMEEESLKAMSLEDAKIRRAELQKARALQSYYEAKARRERTIKSKKYHKVQNKAKRKDFVKKFEEMLQKDPVGALEELQKLELGRMKERMSLKHQNSGKWAKSKAIMAKYDEGARKAMQQQLEVNKDLTQKLATTLNSEGEDDDDGDAADPDLLPDFVNDAEPGLDPANPWMRGKLSKDSEVGDPTAPTEQEQTTSATVVVIEEEEEVNGPEETEEEVLLREFATRRKQRQAMEAENEPETNGDVTEMMMPVITEETEENKSEAEKAPASAAAAAADDDDDAAADEEEEEEEEEALTEFTNLFQELTDSRKAADAAAETCEPDSAKLQQAMFRIKNLEDMDLLDQEVQDQPVEPDTEQPPAAPQKTEGGDKKRKRGIDLNEVLTKEAKVIQMPMAPRTVEDADGASYGQEEEEQRDVIKEAFAGDDVVSDFLKDKRREEDAGKPKVVDLTLPGWGEWGGLGLQPSRSKRRRFRAKTPVAVPRKDRTMGSVIISEKRDSSVSMHQVGALPHPFLRPEQFEATIRSPVGATWNTRKAVRKLTMPRVITKVGAIIQPMSRDDLLKHSRRQEADGTTTATAGEQQKKKDAPQRKRVQKRHKKKKN